MTLYDISQELLSCRIYPGDPGPRAEAISRISDGGDCNISAFSMCAHNGTHVDAPYHFIEGGKTVDRIELDSVVGWAYVAQGLGTLGAEDAEEILRRARLCGNGCEKRILIKGAVVVGEAAAWVFADSGVVLVGNDSQSVGPEEAPMAVHRILLSADVVLLEGLRLEAVPEGAYILCAAPLNIAGFDGSPCRAVLMEL